MRISNLVVQSLLSILPSLSSSSFLSLPLTHYVALFSCTGCSFKDYDPLYTLPFTKSVVLRDNMDNKTPTVTHRDPKSDWQLKPFGNFKTKLFTFLYDNQLVSGMRKHCDVAEFGQIKTTNCDRCSGNGSHFIIYWRAGLRVIVENVSFVDPYLAHSQSSNHLCISCRHYPFVVIRAVCAWACWIRNTCLVLWVSTSIIVIIIRLETLISTGKNNVWFCHNWFAIQHSTFI